MRRQSQDEESEDGSGFVYTATTVRLMEEVCVAFQMEEPVLLVGETGTGKTSSVQELARL